MQVYPMGCGYQVMIFLYVPMFHSQEILVFINNVLRQSWKRSREIRISLGYTGMYCVCQKIYCLSSSLVLKTMQSVLFGSRFVLKCSWPYVNHTVKIFSLLCVPNLIYSFNSLQKSDGFLASIKVFWITKDLSMKAH